MTQLNELLEKLTHESSRRQPAHGCHGYEHTIRVVELCQRLGQTLDADMEVLLPAAILHDAGRPHENHAEHGALIAEKILQDAGFNPGKVAAVIEAIRAHSFSAKLEAVSLEAKILSDADKLDALGAVGVYRTAMYSSELGRPVEDFMAHFDEKLLLLKDMLYTEAAVEVAERRHLFMERFLAEIRDELAGKA